MQLLSKRILREPKQVVVLFAATAENAARWRPRCPLNRRVETAQHVIELNKNNSENVFVLLLLVFDKSKNVSRKTTIAREATSETRYGGIYFGRAIS
jgi:hypothetical protein